MRTLLLSALVLIAATVHAQGDKSKRPSPPASVQQTLLNGAGISIDYSQPAVKGRVIGEELEPKDGQVWRTGANEATVFATNKDIMIEGKSLPAGKYGLFSLVNGDEWTFIFNKTWDQWGAFEYKEADDVLRVKVKAGKSSDLSERMTFTISKEGKVTLLWGNIVVGFMIS